MSRTRVTDFSGGMMEKELLKVVSQLTVIALGLWVVSKALGNGAKHKHPCKDSDATQAAPTSAVWYSGIVAKPQAEPNSVQPQSLLY